MKGADILRCQASIAVLASLMSVSVTVSPTVRAQGNNSSAPPCAGLPNMCPRAVTYQPGWNLVAGTEGNVGTSQGTHMGGAIGSLFTLRPGDTSYESVPVSESLKSGWGYWAYFATPTTELLAQNTRMTFSMELPG